MNVFVCEMVARCRYLDFRPISESDRRRAARAVNVTPDTTNGATEQSAALSKSLSGEQFVCMCEHFQHLWGYAAVAIAVVSLPRRGAPHSSVYE